MSTTTRRLVSEKELVRRINEKFSARFRDGRSSECDELKECPDDSQWANELGAYYIVDAARNVITDKWVNIEKLGRRLRVLDKSEGVAQ
jgi:hypothetical protein